MKKLTQKERTERKARALYLRPLCNMILGYISKLELKEAENLLKAINSTTPSNCAWIEHLLGRVIGESVEYRIDDLRAKKAEENE